MDVNDLKINLDQYLRPEVSSIGGLIAMILKNLMFFGGILMVFAVLYTGIMFITAGGDMQKSAKARANLILAITGLIIILLAESITFWIPVILTGGSTGLLNTK